MEDSNIVQPSADQQHIPDFLRVESPVAAEEDVEMPEGVTSIYVSPEVEGGVPVPTPEGEMFPEAEAAGTGWEPKGDITVKEVP